jgi:hypothetical protein
VSTGGATFGTAGTLDLGAGNTFLRADAVESTYLDNQGWFTFTLTTPKVVDFAFNPGTGFRLLIGDTEDDLTTVSAASITGSSPTGFNANYLLAPDTYYLVVGEFTDPPTTYQVTYSSRTAATSEWYSDLRDDPTNILPLDETLADVWDADVIRRGSYREGNVFYQETLGGPWSTAAMECARNHALWGNQFSALWTDVCPPLFDGVADVETIGDSSVSYHYSFETGTSVGDSTRIIVRTTAWGIWLKPVEENLPPRGVLPHPSPEDYGYPTEAEIEWESPVVELIGLEIADGAGNPFDPDPDSRYAVNYDKQPSFTGGDFNGWQLGNLPGGPPVLLPDWVDGPEDYSITFSSEAVAEGDKTWHALDVPADGFASLTQDYLTDTYDYGVIAGPSEAFGEGVLDDDRGADVAIMVRVHVRSPRFRWIYDGPTVVPPRRIFGRSDGATHGAARALGGRNTVQSGNRVLGTIL